MTTESTQIAYTRAHCLLDCCHCVAFHCTAAPRFICCCPSRRQNKNSEALGDILEDSGLSTTLSPFRGVSLFRARSRLGLHEASKSLYGGDLGCLVGN